MEKDRDNKTGRPGRRLLEQLTRDFQKEAN